MDVKSTFWNGYVDEEIYVEQLEGFEILGKEERVYMLKKVLFGWSKHRGFGIRELISISRIMV